MNILHLSHTPLVGAPGRLCKAMNTLPGHSARWGVLKPENYGGLSFPLDLVWERDRDEIIALARDADVLHLHNYIGLDTQDFAPLDFSRFRQEGRPMVRHLHSTPALIARFAGQSEADVLACPIPKLVIAQYPERFYPCARIVPNLVDIPDTPPQVRSGALTIGYAPSNYRNARSSRWDTKGYRETDKLIRHACGELKRAGQDVIYDLIVETPHEACMVRKSRCDIFIDDLVTGSYHLNTLESLALGCATLTFIDHRITHVLTGLLGDQRFPVVNTRLEELPAVLDHLARHPELTREIGRASHLWMREHWDAPRLLDRFIDSYRQVITHPGQPFDRRFDDSMFEDFMARGLDDLVWQQRRALWPPELPDWIVNLKSTARKTLDRFR
ncbi:MAG: hypothetical protein OJJ21_04505 [Ferrovibrio sp.]|uniref:glycosyltransferase n=1 Tax=Ferrovibrio sp. TaxID=1917215 RepID=UPI002627E3DD|nr:hypothetical protein [Ferrovibrio sp.]MCW0232840.1 hypothetical protein [Ferrovibrio sp.]